MHKSHCLSARQQNVNISQVIYPISTTTTTTMNNSRQWH